MKELIIVVGNIGSGKSTLVKKYQENGYVVIARDMLRYAVGGGNYVFNENYESIIWETELNLLASFLEKKVNIIIDEVGMSKSMRARYISVAKSYNYRIKCIILPILSMEESVKRRLQNNHGNTDKETWKQVWKKFDNMYEEPTKEEGFDEIVKL